MYVPEYSGPMFAPNAGAVAAPEPATPAWWYYCDNPQGYYPYVRQCVSQWQRVAPHPPGTIR
jgi:hypothetical protein